MYKDAKIYVSGHTGMVGSAMMARLRADGYTNIITRTHKELDLMRQADVEAFFAEERPEYVFHIAAKTGGVMLNKTYPVECLSEGTLIALNVLNAANIYNAKGVVYVASANVYPDVAPQPMSEELFMTGMQPSIFGGYALAKTVGIKFCEYVYQEFGKRFISAILPNVYGLYDIQTTVVPMLLDKFADAVTTGKPEVTIWGTGNARREFINSKDVADALLFLMEYGEGGQYYNVGSGEEHTIKELATIIKEISGFTGQLIFDITKPESANRRFLRSQKIYDLGWIPRTDLISGLREVYEEHLKRIKGEQ